LLPPTLQPPLPNYPFPPMPTALAPLMPPEQAAKIILGLAVLTLLIGVPLRIWGKKLPTALALLFDILPLAWMFAFTWSLVHLASDLIPARKHPPFNGNAFASAGLMAFIAALLPRRARGLGVGVMAVLLSSLSMADMLHMRIFGNVLPVGSHGSVLQLWDVRDSIAALFEKQDKWIALYLATGLAMALLWRVKVIPGWKAARFVAYVVPAGALGLFLGPIHMDVSTFLASKWATEVLNREDQMWNAGFIEAHIREISLNIKHKLEHRAPTTEELDQVASYYREEHADHQTDKLPTYGEFKGKNLLVIQIEAFEEWLVGATINGQVITPNLNQLADQGVYYPDIFNEVATTPTADCEYLFLNSNHPLPDGAVAFRREDNHFVTLASTLRDAGYSTLSMHGYRKGMWNRAVIHPRYGFTHSFFAEEIGMTPTVGWGLDDHVLFEKVAEQIKKEPKPWFTYAITLSSHHPYNAIPWNRRRLHLGPLEGTMVGEYMHSAAFVDDALGQLFAQMKKDGTLDDTIVVMYGDHDGHLHATDRDRANLASLTNLPITKSEYIGLGGAQGASDKTSNAGFWYRNRIPFLMLLPGQTTPRVASVYGAQIDFAPTILHYFGIEPPRSFMGHAILPGEAGGFVARWDGSFVAPPLIYDAGLDECRVLTDLRHVSPDDCRAGAEKARKELDMSWLVTNNDLAESLVKNAKPLPPMPPPAARPIVGAACQQEGDCDGPRGYDAHCLGGICMTDPHGPCEHPGSSAPCALGTACYPFSSDLNVCAASCDTHPCAGICNKYGVCEPRP
jgi:phosphoglycerol transferase MdoB-like AlkP superfamily enzyme